MLFIMEEQQKPNSKWKTYLETLPTDLSSLPLMYNKQEIELLEGSEIKQRVGVRYVQRKADYT